MERLIRGGPEFDRLYNCSFYNISQIPLEQRQNVALGLFDIVFIASEEILYVLCLWSIWGQISSGSSSSCYKLMWVLGVLDLVNLSVVGVASGWFQLRGYVYCSAPTLVYTMGCVFTGVWIARSLVEVLLATNRCLVFVAPDIGERLFPDQKKWVWFWTVPPLLIGLADFFFGKTFFFSAYGKTWMLSPHHGYHDEMEELYMDTPLLWWNWHTNALMVVLPGIYVAFFVALWRQSRHHQIHAAVSAGARRTFVQVMTIVAINCVGCYTTAFLTNYYFSLPEPLQRVSIFVLKYTFLESHGLPPVIYLTLNKTIQNDCIELIKRFFQLAFLYSTNMVAARVNPTTGTTTTT